MEIPISLVNTRGPQELPGGRSIVSKNGSLSLVDRGQASRCHAVMCNVT